MADRLKNWESMVERGHLYLLDKIPHGDPDAGHALSSYTNSINKNRQSRQWNRTIKWVENLLFGLGHHYINDILLSRLGADSGSGSSISGNEDIIRNIPRPTNDLLGRYIETNISLLTENRPIPRVTPLSDSVKDRKAAELSELTIEYLWEELNMPEKHREIARLLLYTGIAWLETWYDPLQARYLTAPQTQEYPNTVLGNGISVPVPRELPQIDPETGEVKLKEKVEWGDIVANVISGFEMHLPLEHYWNGDDMGWIMREKYVPIDALRDKYLNPDVKTIVNSKNGYFTDALDQTGAIVVHNFPLWWWERLIDMTEGPGTSLYTGVPEQWEGYNIVRYFDRKPNPTWPKGRTIITVGDKLLYDSPKDIGARAFDPRWPKRWHPYTRYRWEAQAGSIFGRSLVSKLLPKLKRVNSIDTTMIMWRRTVPIASWLMPKGTNVVEDFFQGGMPGAILEYDPRRTAGAEPKPIFPPSYPAAALQERETQLSEMESIAGTESILRGERPTGVNSSVMLDSLRKLALSSRSPTLQAWDESLQEVGTTLVQETIKNIKKDERYKQRLALLAREKASKFAIDEFSGMNLSDNVQVRIDTASLALISREAKQQRALELLQYSQGLNQLPPGLRAKIIDELGWPDAMTPQGADIDRGRALIQYLKSKRFDLVIPMPEDDPYVIHEMLVDESKSQSFIDLEPDIQVAFFKIIDLYKQEIENIEQSRLQFQQQVAGAAQGVPPGQG